MKTSDKLRLLELEKEVTDCFLDRYVGNLPDFYDQNPDVGKMSEELFQYLDGQPVNEELPTYFHYWEDEESRQRLWAIEHDPIARGLLARLDRTSKHIIDGKYARLKQVGDGGHAPVEGDCKGSLSSY